MAGKHYRNEDDQILINMARKGMTNAQIAAALNRSQRGVENRRSRLRAEGADIPNMPRTRRKKSERPAQVCFEVPEAVPQTVAKIGPPAGPIMPDVGADPIAHIADPVERIAAEIDRLTEREEWLNGQLAELGAEKKKLLEQLTPLVNALLGVDCMDCVDLDALPL